MAANFKIAQITQATAEALNRMRKTHRSFKYGLIEKAVLQYERREDDRIAKQAQTRRENMASE